MKPVMRHLAMPVAILSVFLVGLTGYAKPITAGGTVSSLVHQYCGAYKHFPHFRAVAGAGGWQGSVRGMPWAVGCAAGQTSVKSAVYLANARCESVKKKYEVSQSCRLYFLGDIDVSGMSSSEVERVKGRYQENRKLTSRDLQ